MSYKNETAIASLIVAASLLAGCGKAKEEAAGETEAPTPVMVETAVLGAIDHVVTADAVLFPINQSSVTPKISAPVKRMLVNRGDHVRAGQVIADLESSDLAAAVQEARYQYEQAQSAYATVTGATVVEDETKARADVQSAQSAFDAAKKLYDSRAALQKEGALAQKQVDETKLQMVQAQTQLETAQQHLKSLNGVGRQEAIRTAQAQMDAAKAHQEALAVQLSYARVVSPISGVVAERQVNVGETASAGMPLISVVDISQVRAIANVPAKEASSLRVGRPARVAGPDGDIPGTVTVVSPAANANATTVEVWVQIANPGERLKPGETARVSIIAETIQNTLVVPASALLNGDEGRQKVMVISSDSVAHERMVTVGVRQGDRVQILSGVQPGEQVVTSGGLGLDDKAKVTIQQPKSEDDDDDDSGGDEAKPDDAKGKAAKDAKGKKE
ncbi:MAG TPA: efflux RND transporter periplasmic adaptor subunit [Bryobacteraceae bacterium]|jgi:multidrug efflux pump subunit AcrA (membrane-fusion protein)|nr:efflux RND transporter periplasmic adaptor subunit [Bryobacteraceae bacterium]